MAASRNLAAKTRFLAAEGHDAKTIASLIGTTAATVRETARQHGIQLRRLRPAPRAPEPPAVLREKYAGFNVAFVPLPHGDFAVIDSADYPEISKRPWHLTGKAGEHYAATNRPGGGLLKLHHAIMGSPPPGMMVDHIDRDKLNNTRANLRFVTPSENSRNRGARA